MNSLTRLKKKLFTFWLHFYDIHEWWRLLTHCFLYVSSSIKHRIAIRKIRKPTFNLKQFLFKKEKKEGKQKRKKTATVNWVSCIMLYFSHTPDLTTIVTPVSDSLFWVLFTINLSSTLYLAQQELFTSLRPPCSSHRSQIMFCERRENRRFHARFPQNVMSTCEIS